MLKVNNNQESKVRKQMNRIVTKSMLIFFMAFGLELLCLHRVSAQPSIKSEMLTDVLQKPSLNSHGESEVSLVSLLKYLESRYNIMFLYQDKDLANKFVSSQEALLKRKPGKHIAKLLDKLHLTYAKVDASTYEIFPMAKSGEDVVKKKVQFQVSGTVRDASSNSPLPGVNVLVKGTTVGAATNKKGHYTLSISSPNDTLIFTYIGYNRKERAVDGHHTINVSLSPKVIKGQQMVVIGYGSERKSNLAGAQTTISSADLENANLTSPDQALQGRVAGVNVHTNSHAPGGSISVTVRGTSSLTAGGSPLYVIDGVPISTSYQTGDGSGGVGNGARPNPLNSIDLSNVANIEVLKGAAAAAIYGSRAANGVVLITTKEGKKNSQNVDFQSSVGISTISHKLNFMSASQYALQANERQQELNNMPGNNPAPLPYTQQQITNFGQGTNWQNQVFRQAVSENYNLTFSGGTNNLTYMLSGDTKLQNGIIRNSGFNRYGIKANIQSDISKKLTVGTNLSYDNAIDNRVRTSAKGYGSQPGLISSLINASPTIPPRDSLGNLSNFSSYAAGGNNENPLILTDNYKERANTNRFVGNFHFTYDILNNLELRSRLGADQELALLPVFSDWLSGFCRSERKGKSDQ